MEKVICNCLGLTREQIEESVKNGADTVEKVGDDIQAGTICGVCQSDIEDIIEEVK